jgi:hypothetical protein
MKSINEQLGIGIAPSPMFPTRYTRGLKTMNPQLGTEDWSLNYYNDVGFINANGYSNAYGTLNCKRHCKQLFPLDNKLKGACKASCKTTCNKNSKCPPKGGTPYPTKEEVLKKAGELKETKNMESLDIQENAKSLQQKENAKKIIIGVAVVGVIAVGLIILRRKMKNK